MAVLIAFFLEGISTSLDLVIFFFIWFLILLGFSYLGPIDGHDLNQLLPIFRTIQKRLDGPILLHVVTKKGKGYMDWP